MDDLKRRTTLLIMIIGTLVIFLNISRGLISGNKILQILSHPFVYTAIASVLILWVMLQFLPRFLPPAEIGILYYSAFLTIMDSCSSFVGFGFFLMAYLLIYKFGYLTKRAHLKTIVYCLSIFIMEGLSLSKNSSPWEIGVNMALFTVFFIAFLYFLFESEVNQHILKHEKYSRDLELLEQEKNALEEGMAREKKRLTLLEEEISRKRRGRKKKISLDEFGLTKTEKTVVEILVEKKATNKTIARDMNVQTNTVKIHLYNIYGKTGVKSRTELIGLVLGR